jgi:hypothetical protein
LYNNQFKLMSQFFTTFLKQLIFISIIFSISVTNSLAQNCSSISDIVVSSTEVWDFSSKGTNYVVNKSICIESGGSLTITGITILFDGYYNIIVHEGGILNLENATLKPNTGASVWGGIILRGDHTEKLCDPLTESLNDSKHGKLYINGALLESCDVGLRLVSTTDNTKSAGIFNINNATFYNNLTAAIKLNEYPAGDYECRVNSIANSKFTTSTSSAAPDYFIQMINYKSLTLLGCEFEVYIPNKTITKGILVAGLDAGGLVMEASEYVNPFDGQNSIKHTQPKRNKFENLEMGIYFSGSTSITPFQSLVKNCDFNTVKLGIKIIFATDIKILCNKYTAQEYNSNSVFDRTLIQYTYDDGISIDEIPYPTISPVSVFVLCDDTYTSIDILDNECNWDTDFSNKPAYGIIMFPQFQNNTGSYIISNNKFTFNGIENSSVTGIFFHGDYTWSPQLRNNEFYALKRDIELVSGIKYVGNTCYEPVIGTQGIYYEGTPDEFTTCNGNIFSNPSLGSNGNIYSNASVTYYSLPYISPQPKFEPTQKTACVSTPYVSTNLSPLNYDCSVPPVSGLLNNEVINKGTLKDCFQITPNPVYNNCYFKIENNYYSAHYNKKINIYDCTLSLLTTAKFHEDENTLYYDASNLPEGLYFVTLYIDDVQVCTQRLIKK